MLLGLDTSTRLAGVALYHGERGLIAEYNWHSANRHTAELMPQVAQMMAQARVGPADLTAVAVALGPGSFTGLRVALAAAKGLALAQGIKLLGVSTLDGVAYPHQSEPTPVVAVVQAGRGRVCWALYAHGPAGWAAQTGYQLSTVTELAQKIVRPTVFAGELLPADQTTLLRCLGKARASFLPPARTMRRAGYIAELAWQRLAAGQADDPATLSPIYLHEPASPKSAGA
jgi:tRNA threonylcarbamoyladenosine biosynthesis protein TsaB